VFSLLPLCHEAVQSLRRVQHGLGGDFGPVPALGFQFLEALAQRRGAQPAKPTLAGRAVEAVFAGDGVRVFLHGPAAGPGHPAARAEAGPYLR